MGLVPASAALIVALVVFVPYVAVSAAQPATVRSWPLRVPTIAASWDDVVSWG
jgi:uncharacterized membrane protein